MLPQKDPYLSHHIVHNQLKKQVHKESESRHVSPLSPPLSTLGGTWH